MSVTLPTQPTQKSDLSYLRDNMVVRAENMVQRPLNYALVDEVDSILIDEARTPLIVSGANAVETSQALPHGRPLCKIVGQRRLHHRCAV